MRIAPLQLEELFTGKIRLVPIVANYSGETQLRVDTTPTFRRDNADPFVWNVQLVINFGPADTRPVGYEGEIEMVGRFRVVTKELQEEKHLELVAVNALSILYSSAREVIAMLTAHGPCGKMLLPSVSFADQKLLVAPGDQAASKSDAEKVHKVAATGHSHSKATK
jgi:preprotein translocase subunit SecB